MRRKFSAFILMVLVLQLTVCDITVSGRAFNIATAQQYNRILFLIDCSNSMTYHDEDKLIAEITKMFVDGCYSKRTDIGFVTYNDQILNTYPLTSLADAADRTAIKSDIDSITRQGSTDIGMALKYGMDMFINDPKADSKPIIVLFSDGETDLTYTRTGRTYKDSSADENAAYEKAKTLNCPVYTVGISRDGSLNTEYLTNIAQSTGGKEYEIKDSKQLLSMFNTLFADVTGVEVAAKDVVKGTGEPQSITVDIPSQYADETNIILQHEAELKNVSLGDNSDNTNVYQSSDFAGVKLNDSKNKTATINFTAEKDDEIKVNAINFINVFPKVDMPDNLSSAEVKVEAKLYGADGGEALTDADLYNGLTAELIAADPSTGESAVIPMENTGNSFVAAYKNDSPKPVSFHVNVGGLDYTTESEPAHIEMTNSSPATKGNFDKMLLHSKSGKEVEYDLNDYFKDLDGDSLIYEIDDKTGSASDAVIKDGKLLITPIELGSDTVSVTATDSRGAKTTGNFGLDVVPLWVYYKNAIITTGVIFIGLLAAYLLLARKKKPPIAESVVEETTPNTRFTGARFEGYFLETLSGNDVPVLNWSAKCIENKQRISLGELFHMLEVDENLPEAQNIYFTAGNNNTVIFNHDTDCVVSVGNNGVPKGRKVVLNYDDKLYVVFEDNVSEIEVRYKRARKPVYI